MCKGFDDLGLDLMLICDISDTALKGVMGCIRLRHQGLDPTTTMMMRKIPMLRIYVFSSSLRSSSMIEYFNTIKTQVDDLHYSDPPHSFNPVKTPKSDAHSVLPYRLQAHSPLSNHSTFIINTIHNVYRSRSLPRLRPLLRCDGLYSSHRVYLYRCRVSRSILPLTRLPFDLEPSDAYV